MIKHPVYVNDVAAVAGLQYPWGKLTNKSILITGASGLIGSFLIDVIMYKNNVEGLACHIYALSRSEEHAKNMFSDYWDDDNFSFISHDVNESMEKITIGNIDYVVHMASNTHPVAYALDPIGTITANIIGTQNLLDFAVQHNATRFVFTSSNEIYGENRGDVELFDEEYCGYINSNTLRAGYPESKRCGEALCQAYRSQMNLDVVIPRLTRSYGPMLRSNDSKAMSQFIFNAISGEDIVLKSDGAQHYSYTYVADAVSGLLAVLLLGINGEAYNISDVESNITLKNLALILAKLSGTKLKFDLPSKIESSGFSRATKALLDSSKLQALGWHAEYSLREGLEHTLKVLTDGENHSV